MMIAILASLLTYGYLFSVSFRYSAVSWSALSDCGISWSYPHAFRSFLVYYSQNKSVILCKLLNCLSVHSNSCLSHNNYCYSRSIVEYVRCGKPKASSYKLVCILEML